MVLYVEDEGFERVEVSLLGAIGGLHRAGEGVIGAESKLVIHPDDPVKFATDSEVAKGRQRVHHGGGGVLRRMISVVEERRRLDQLRFERLRYRASAQASQWIIDSAQQAKLVDWRRWDGMIRNWAFIMGLLWASS